MEILTIVGYIVGFLMIMAWFITAFNIEKILKIQREILAEMKKANGRSEKKA